MSRLRVLLIASTLALVPALCGAQSDPASTSGSGTQSATPPAADAPQSKGLFDWLTKPQANKPATPAAGARGAAPAQAQGQAETPAPAAPSAGASPSATTPPTTTPPAAVVNPVVPTPSTANTPNAPSNGARAYTPPPPVDTATPAPPVIAPPAGPRSGIALILPAKAEGFARAAEVTRKGFMAAREQDPGKPAVTVFETDGSANGAQEAYRQALAKNVAVIVGPLTKGEVAALQNERFPVPTLMLNSPDGPLNNVPGLYMLALSTESEARAAAEAAFRPGVSSAVVVTTMSPLSKRASAAFQEAWTGMGGTVKDVIEYTGNPVKIKSAVDRAKAQVVFLAADTDRARLIKPFLGRNTAVIGTSQVYSGNARVEAPGGAGAVDPQKTNDLNGLRFIDMPWLHQPDHPAAMVFAHPEPPLSADLERLYALGIDAYRVAEQLRRSRTSFELDGVTGRLNVHEGLIDRQPIEAEYRDGAVVPLENSVLAHGEGGGARGTVR